MLTTYWPLIWLAIAIAAALAEGFTVQLISIWFAISGAVTALVTLLVQIDFAWQLMLFSLLGLLLLILTRPLVKKKLQVHKECTNADMVIGKVGKVVLPIEDTETPGRVLVSGMDWSAKSADTLPIERGTPVRVRAIEGVTLIVEREAAQSTE